MSESHFLAIDHDIDSDHVYGIYDRFERARDDLAARRVEKARIEAEARARRKPGAIGDPGPYVPMEEYGIEDAVIEEWQGRRLVAAWERDWTGEWWCRTWPLPAGVSEGEPTG